MKFWPKRSTEPKPHKHQWERHVTESSGHDWTGKAVWTKRQEWRGCPSCGEKETTGGWRRDEETGAVTPYEVPS